ncbi:MAG: sigma-70 family RNA polymerase sigma factor [Armatimonadetes bacterium]|nr:sigma-70 family RNA polymerase sigma factor [Candidatus Hippobium faecium]
MEYSDAQINVLIKKSKKGNRDAFNKLMEIYETKVFNFAYRLSMNYEEASDITVESFTRVFKSIKGFRHEANFTSWCFTIVKNVYLDRLKIVKKNQHQSLDQDIYTNEGNIQREFSDEALTPEEEILENERQKEIIDIIDSLPPEQAVPIKMYHLQGLGYEDISKILNVPLGTVKSRINRARIKLEEKFSETDD